MQRQTQNLSAQVWDVLIVGGGITGACVAWDAAQRGLKVALVDKGDFAHATSSAPSKLIHGGLRYLKNLEFGLVRESLRERRVMEEIAPHQVVPLPFLLPAYGWSNQSGLPMLSAAMALYEGLSFDKGWLEENSQRLPVVKALRPKQALKLEPILPSKHLSGAFIYYDCRMHSPERLTLEFLLSAAEHGAELANYVEVTGFDVQEGCMRGVQARDLISGENLQIQARVTINAAGPWADLLLGLMDGKPAKKLRRSKGIHIITRRLTQDHALTLGTASGRHLFLIPWRGFTLIGTTDKAYEDHPDHFRVSESDILELIDEVNQILPAAQLTRDDVRHFYGGLRPLVEEETEIEAESYQLSRKFEVYDHAERGLESFITVIGGKYTTARLLAEQTVDLLYRKLGLPPVACQTAHTPVWGKGPHHLFSELKADLQQHYPLVSEALLEHLCHNYGQRARPLLEQALNQTGQLEPLWQHEPDILAEVDHAVQTEMAMHLDDLLFRRTGLATLGPPADEVLQRVSERMASLRGWGPEDLEQEQLRVQNYYHSLHDLPSKVQAPSQS